MLNRSEKSPSKSSSLFKYKRFTSYEHINIIYWESNFEILPKYFTSVFFNVNRHTLCDTCLSYTKFLMFLNHSSSFWVKILSTSLTCIYTVLHLK